MQLLLFCGLSACPLFLVDPGLLALLIRMDLLWLEPQSDLLLSALDTIGAMADVATNIDGIVTADGTRGRCKRVGCSEDH
jgi:hypothetical protein